MSNEAMVELTFVGNTPKHANMTSLEFFLTCISMVATSEFLVGVTIHYSFEIFKRLTKH